MTNIFTWFNRPYPFDGSWKFHIRNAIVGGLFVTFFLAMFRPFGMQISDDVFWQAMLFLSGFGMITALSLLLLGVIIQGIPSFFNEKDWTVGREIFVNILGILMIATANMFFDSTVNVYPVSSNVFLHWIWMTFLVGLGPIIITVAVKQSILNRRHLEGAEKFNTQLRSSSLPQQTNNPEPKSALTLSGDNQSESLSLTPSSLLYLEASDNYVRLFFEENQKLENTLIRSTLKKMEGQLSTHPQFFRCHRTYLVNLNRVEKVSGNAQGYKLHLSGTDILVPVSRSLNGEIDKRLS